MITLRCPVIRSTLLWCGFMIAVAAYEQIVLGWHFAREEAPIHDGWHWMRTAGIAVLSFLLVASLAQSQVRREQVSVRAGALVFAVALLSLAAIALLAASPGAFAQIGAEDSTIEWLSAVLLFGAAGLMGWRLRDRTRRQPAHGQSWVPMVVGLGFAALFALMALEEVSWFQRQIGFATPEAIAARNWQGEFNLHNFHTDITELALYSGTGAFLLLLPLLRRQARQCRPQA